MRVEFLKVRARALRFGEEVQILQEEQRRVLKSLANDAYEWERRIVLSELKESPILHQGAVAYAARQRHLLLSLQMRFRQIWTNSGLGGVVDVHPDPENGPRDELAGELGDGLLRMTPDSDDEAINPLKGYDSDDE